MLVFGFEEVAAGQALVGLVHAVDDAHVGLEVWQLGEPGVRADRAAERLLTGVLADVQLENARVGKGSIADLLAQHKKVTKTI